MVTLINRSTTSGSKQHPIRDNNIYNKQRVVFLLRFRVCTFPYFIWDVLFITHHKLKRNNKILFLEAVNVICTTTPDVDSIVYTQAIVHIYHVSTRVHYRRLLHNKPCT